MVAIMIVVMIVTLVVMVVITIMIIVVVVVMVMVVVIVIRLGIFRARIGFDRAAGDGRQPQPDRQITHDDSESCLHSQNFMAHQFGPNNCFAGNGGMDTNTENDDLHRNMQCRPAASTPNVNIGFDRGDSPTTIQSRQTPRRYPP
ncbi:MAG: hypothetical protein AAFN70_19415 [Planctomycetota bacterium]